MRNAKGISAILAAVIGAAVFVRSAAQEQPAGAKPLQSYYPPSSWSGVPGVLNMSMHAYYDRNRNGIYEVGERGLAKIAFELHKPDGSRVFNWTNVSGFANFLMGAPPNRSDIASPGTYWFVGSVPPGWQATSGNLRQSRTIVASPGSLTGLAAVDAPVPVGLAPDLTIRGRTGGELAPGAAVLARGPQEQVLTSRTVSKGLYTFDVTPGFWSVDTGAKSRRVRVGFAPVYVSAPCSAGQRPTGRRTELLGFDDLLSASTLLEVPNGLGGLNWANWVAVRDTFYGGEGYVNGAVSGSAVIYNSSGHSAEISSSNPFDFVGGFFSVAWLKAEGEEMQIRAWVGNELVCEDVLPLSSLGPVYFDADYRGITRVSFETRHHWQVVADDLQFRTAGS